MFGNLSLLAFGLIGGLGLFLLGMKNMSDGMQAVAGGGLRRMIGAVTNNRFMAVGVGTLVTTLIQSSSITTVMVLGFVNSGLMTLQQAVSIIMGANIGTTITGWIIALKVGKYGLPLLGLSAFGYLFWKGERFRNWCMVLMGIGMVFYGLEIMKSSCSVIQESPDLEAWFARFRADTYPGVLACAITGCMMTVLLQSSSATLGITITLAVQGVIPVTSAMALVLGENIGTTVTALLASLGATTNARRAAYFHCLFNVVGVLLVTAVFAPYSQLVLRLIPEGVEAQIAATHTIFNVSNMLIFLPFTALVVRGLEWLVPGKPYKEQARLTDLNIRLLDSPMLAVEQSRQELLKMGDSCIRMLEWGEQLTETEEPDLELARKMRQREQVLDRIQDEVSLFLTNVLASNVPRSVAAECRQQLRLADEYEATSDWIRDLLRHSAKLHKEGLNFSPKQREHLVGLLRMLRQYATVVNQEYRSQSLAKSPPGAELGKAIRKQIKQLRQEHLADLSEVSLPSEVTVCFLYSVNSCRRIRDHLRQAAHCITRIEQA